MKLELTSITGNRLGFGDWFILIDLGLSKVELRHKDDGRNMTYYTVEEAIEAAKNSVAANENQD